jgi:hypothetical protein
MPTLVNSIQSDAPFASHVASWCGPAPPPSNTPNPRPRPLFIALFTTSLGSPYLSLQIITPINSQHPNRNKYSIWIFS